MERSKAEAVIEAILFTMGDSVEISRLAEVIEEDVKTTKSILKDMAARYEEENRGIGLTQFDDSVQLCTKADMPLFKVGSYIFYSNTMISEISDMTKS